MSPPAARFLLAVTFEYVRDVGARRGEVNARDELVRGERSLSGRDAVPVGGTAWARVVRGDDTRLPAGRAAVVLRDLFQIPAADLYVSLRVAQRRVGVAAHLLGQLAHAGLGGPLARDRRSHLHQPDLARVSFEIGRAHV